MSERWFTSACNGGIVLSLQEKAVWQGREFISMIDLHLQKNQPRKNAEESKEGSHLKIMSAISELSNIVRETGHAIHIYHGHGHLEKVHENALANQKMSF